MSERCFEAGLGKRLLDPDPDPYQAISRERTTCVTHGDDGHFELTCRECVQHALFTPFRNGYERGLALGRADRQ